MTVGNLTSMNTLNQSSAYSNKYVDITAPGADIWGMNSYGRYNYKSGSSFATSRATGTCAWLYALDTNMTANQCKQIVCNTANSNYNLRGKVNQGRTINCFKIKYLKKGASCNI